MGSATQQARSAADDYGEQIEMLFSRVTTATALGVIALSLALLLTAIAVLKFVLRLAPSKAAEPNDDGDESHSTDMSRTQAELTHKDDTVVDMTGDKASPHSQGTEGDNGLPPTPATAAPTAAVRQQEPVWWFKYDANRERQSATDISDMPPSSCATAKTTYKLSEDTIPPDAKRFKVDADADGSAQAKAAGAQ